MKKVGFLGYGKIARVLYKEICEKGYGTVAFVQDPALDQDELADVTVTACKISELYENVDLVIECATADALNDNVDMILKYSDLLLFSITAFADQEFMDRVTYASKKYGRNIYIPHGAILGMDGILDGRQEWSDISIETIKNPQSLGRNERERTVLYDGSTKEACRLFPRNVNVHAAVALAGIGFDQTHSVIISDPSVNTNTHIIRARGNGIETEIKVSSFSESGVTGRYTPLSACGSLRRILSADGMFHMV